MGYNGRNMYEQIIFMSKGKRQFPKNLSITDVLSHKSIHQTKRLHETEKPIELLKDILRFSANKGETVLDPFAGSLSLAEAGMQLGINTINIDINGEVLEESLNKRNYTEVKL